MIDWLQARRQEIKWGVFFCKKKWKMGVFVKKWTFPPCRGHYVQYQYFLFYTVLIWGCVRTPLPTGLDWLSTNKSTVKSKVYCSGEGATPPQVLYIVWQWRNFVPYLCQLIFAAILWVKTVRNACHCDSAYIRFNGKSVLIWTFS